MSDFLDKLSDLFFVVFVFGIPALLIFGKPYYRQWMAVKERQLELEARLAAEKAAQYATTNSELEARVRVLEQIVTDGGIETASQIEALRKPRLTGGDPLK